jgi:isopentenyl-diphosphate delta-isomerase
MRGKLTTNINVILCFIKTDHWKPVEYSMTVSEDMLIDVVDALDSPIGTVQRSDALPRRVNFRVVNLFLFNNQGELLIQQLAASRERHPGAWGSSVAGYLFAGESYMQAANRRLSQELGVQTALQAYGKTSMNDAGCTKFITLYLGTCDGPFAYDHNHIAKLEFHSLPALRSQCDTGERRFTPTFLHMLNFYEHQA